MIELSNNGLQGILNNNVTTTSNLEKICKVLDVTPNYFFDYDTEKTDSIHLNNGSGQAIYSVGNIRGDITNVAEKDTIYTNVNNELEKLKKELEYLKKQVSDKDDIIQMQKDFIDNLKRQIK